MGIPLFARLWWDGHRGHAACGDVDVELHTLPAILGAPVEIDYSEAHPDQYVCPPEIRPRACDRRREMELLEIQIVRGWLRGLAAAVERYRKDSP